MSQSSAVKVSPRRGAICRMPKSYDATSSFVVKHTADTALTLENANPLKLAVDREGVRICATAIDSCGSTCLTLNSVSHAAALSHRACRQLVQRVCTTAMCESSTRSKLPKSYN